VSWPTGVMPDPEGRGDAERDVLAAQAAGMKVFVALLSSGASSPFKLIG